VLFDQSEQMRWRAAHEAANGAAICDASVARRQGKPAAVAIHGVAIARFRECHHGLETPK
jgi:hypothetical protein